MVAFGVHQARSAVQTLGDRAAPVGAVTSWLSPSQRLRASRCDYFYRRPDGRAKRPSGDLAYGYRKLTSSQLRAQDTDVLPLGYEAHTNGEFPVSLFLDQPLARFGKSAGAIEDMRPGRSRSNG